jgi:hypothetical protein
MRSSSAAGPPGAPGFGAGLRRQPVPRSRPLAARRNAKDTNAAAGSGLGPIAPDNEPDVRDGSPCEHVRRVAEQISEARFTRRRIGGPTRPAAGDHGCPAPTLVWNAVGRAASGTTPQGANEAGPTVIVEFDSARDQHFPHSCAGTPLPERRVTTFAQRIGRSRRKLILLAVKRRNPRRLEKPILGSKNQEPLWSPKPTKR